MGAIGFDHQDYGIQRTYDETGFGRLIEAGHVDEAQFAILGDVSNYLTQIVTDKRPERVGRLARRKQIHARRDFLPEVLGGAN